MWRDIISSSIATMNNEHSYYNENENQNENENENENEWRTYSTWTFWDVNKNIRNDSNQNRPYTEIYNFLYNETISIENVTSDELYSTTAIDDDKMAMSDEDIVALLKMVVMSIVLGMMILITIIGNVFVIAAIILERNLQNVANYLVASLAVADLFVACLVMPLGAVYEISAGWILGPELCDIWTSCDVLCCTASILHLVAIAADRYWTVTNIDYNNLRTPGRVFFMIFCVWFAALIVSLAPQFGWKDPDYMKRIEEQQCMVSQDVAYQIFATCCTFYVPLLVILVLYWKIYKIARKRIQRHKQRPTAYGAAVVGNQRDTTLQRKDRQLKTDFGKTDKQKNTNNGQSCEKQQTANEQNTKDRISIPQVETEFSTSNFDSKSHAGTELTTVSSDADESRQSGIDDISTVSHQVATATYQQHAIAITLTTPQLNLLTIATGASKNTRAGGGSGGGAGAGGGNGNGNGNEGNASGSGTGTGSGIAKQLAAAAAAAAAASGATSNPHQKLAKRRQMLEAKRERKAAQTLAIITGAFAVCWLPFFVMALLLSLCKSCQINAAVASLFLWLGYFNSTLNPIIYTIFNPEFRRAFKRILCGRKRLATHSRSGKI